MNNVVDSLNISSQEPINTDLIIEYTPATEVQSYVLELYRDDTLYKVVNSNVNKISSIVLDETGTYKIIIKELNIEGVELSSSSGLYIIDKEAPVIEVSNQLLTMKKGETLDVFSDVLVTDNYDNDILSKVTTNYNELDFNSLGLKKLVYTVTDEAGNTATKTVNINVINNTTSSLAYIQAGIITVFVILLYLLLKVKRSIKLEKRIARFSLRNLEDSSLSLLDKVGKWYKKLITCISKGLEKSVFITKYSRKFRKYLMLSKGLYDTEVDFVSSKLVLGFVFVLLAIFSKTIRYMSFSVYELIIPFIIGFFVLNVIYFSKYKLLRNRIENDLLQAIIIMNNAFKSGRSITQAVNLVTTELDGPISEEFKKMSLELSLGLGVDVVFGRFSERIDIEEVAYLTASLSILNRTGGNITKVFSSIEKSLFNRKKLKLELKALIGSSKIIAYVLSVVPIFFVVIISIVNPDYFLSFFTTSLGIILFIFMLIYYLTYIIVVNKLMKVRM